MKNKPPQTKITIKPDTRGLKNAQIPPAPPKTKKY